MNAKKLVLFALVSFFYLSMAGCGGGSGPSGGGSNPPNPVSVAITASSTTVDGVAGNIVTLTASVTNDTGAGGVTWTVSGGGTISGSATSATYTPPAAGASAATATITATSVTDNTKSASVHITIPAKATISTATIASGAVGTGFSASLAAAGGISPYTWSISNGTLPAGLTMSVTGAISGTPMAAGAGTSTVTFKVTDSGTPNPLTATADLVVNVAAAPPIRFGSATLADGTMTQAYTGTITATGGAGTLANTIASGAFPDGISMSSTGVLTGTPIKEGTFSFTVRASDAFGDSATQAYTMNIANPALRVNAPTPPTGYVGSNYTSTNLTATGGSGAGYTWAVSSGSALPDGLALSAAGVITGKPTTASPSVITSVTVTDSASNTATGSLNFVIKSGISVLTLPSLPNAYAGSHYSLQLTASGGSGTGYAWTVGSPAAVRARAVVRANAPNSGLPPGITLSSSGLLSGIPQGSGTWNFTFTVTDDANNSASFDGSITVTPGIAIGFFTLPKGYQNAVYPGATFSATGGSGSGYSWTWAAPAGSSLPAGMTLSTAGTISGTPTGSGTFNVIVAVTDDASNTASQTFSVTIEAALTISTASPRKSGTINTGYSTTLAANGGSGAGYTWAVIQGASQLQALSLNLSSAGVLSGSPTIEGSATFTAQVTDSESHTATGSLTVTVYKALTIATTSLPAGQVGAAYSQTLDAAGGTGTGYTWTAVNSNLGTYGLGLSAAGVVSGTPTTPGTATFTPRVTDSAGSSVIALNSISFTIYAALTVPATALPDASVSVPYSATLTATGGSGNLTWTVQGLPADGLTFSANGYVLTISGTPTKADRLALNITVKDNITNQSTLKGYGLVINSPAPLTFTTSTTLAAGTVNQAYLQSIAAAGGVGPYTWAVNGNNLPTDGSAQPLANGLTVSSNGTLTLKIGGTPLATGPVAFTAKLSDSANHSAGPTQFSIQMNAAGEAISGHISLLNTCGNATPPPVTVSLNTTPNATTVTTDSSGNYAFDAIPNGTYTITPSITGPASMFSPTSYPSVTVNNAPVTGKNFSASLGYTVSGTVNYAGTQSGPIYVSVEPSQCGTGYGTSVSAPGAFTIRGVPPGTYRVKAWRDALGYGYPNAVDAIGATPSFAITNANITNASVTISDPASFAISSSPAFTAISPIDSGAVVVFQPITGKNANNDKVELPMSYRLEWATDSSFSSSSSYTFPAGISNGTNALFLNSATRNILGSFANGTTYYFRMRAVNASGNGSWATFGGGAPTGVTVGAPTGGNTVSGTINFSATPAGPLVVGFFDQSTGQTYSTMIADPVSPQSFTVQVPTGSNYFFFAVLDQNRDGIIGTNDLSSTRNNNSTPLTISGDTTKNLTLNPPDSSASVTTHLTQSNNGATVSDKYNLSFQVREAVKLPVAVTLASGPGVLEPVDMDKCFNCGTPQFQYDVALPPGVTPSVGNVYGFLVMYSDGLTETVNATVTGVLTSTALPTLISPTGSGAIDTPSFDWTYPTNAGNYIYQFWLCCGTNGNIWHIPSQNSSATGFTSDQITPPLAWGVDPTDSSNTPSLSALDAGNTYSWTVQAQDSSGNSAQAQAQFTITAGSLRLPAPNPPTLPGAVVNTQYSGTIAAIGGVPPYGWTVAGMPQNNLNASSSDACGCLIISGTPTSATTLASPVSFQVTVQDSNGAIYGPITYTVAVSSN